MSLLLEADIKSLLRKYSVKPRKDRGQSFLKSEKIAGEIIASAEISQDDCVLEIGGGLGILTAKLADVAREVIVIELELGLVNALREMFSDRKNVIVIHGDALKVNLPEFDRVVANLPYSISSEITFRLLNEESFGFGILMYQKEFSERLLANPGGPDYSRLSVDFQYLGEAQHVMDVEAGLFYPVPAVDSTVLKVTKRVAGPFANDSDVFFWTVHGLYSYPNKQLKKALKIWFKNIGTPNISDEFFSKLNDVNDQERLRNLSLDQLVKIADRVNELVERGDLPGPRGVRK